MTLEQAIAYLTPHPSTNGPVHLNPVKMREAIAVIRASLPQDPPARRTNQRIMLDESDFEQP